MKIFLIGMPGSGKTTLGKKLAAELKIPFLDLDHEIESRANMPITEIFQQKGEDQFRSIESKLLNELAVSSASFVMATGGGAPCFHDGMDVINKNGTSMFLDLPIDLLLKNTHQRSTRPLLAHNDEVELRSKLSMMRETRLPVYSQAHITLKQAEVDAALKALGLTR